MIYYLIITIVINTGLSMVSFLFLRRNLHPLEILVDWLWISIFLFLLKEIIELNYKWVKIDRALPFYWSHNINNLILIPSLTVWLVYVYFSKAVQIYKGMMTLCWFAVLIGFQHVNRALGYVQFLDWSLTASFIQWCLLLVLTLSFASCFRLLMKKEDLLTREPYSMG
mgnify:CR=1 FL=1